MQTDMKSPLKRVWTDEEKDALAARAEEWIRNSPLSDPKGAMRMQSGTGDFLKQVLKGRAANADELMYRRVENFLNNYKPRPGRKHATPSLPVLPEGPPLEADEKALFELTVKSWMDNWLERYHYALDDIKAREEDKQKAVNALARRIDVVSEQLALILQDKAPGLERLVLERMEAAAKQEREKNTAKNKQTAINNRERREIKQNGRSAPAQPQSSNALRLEAQVLYEQVIALFNDGSVPRAEGNPLSVMWGDIGMALLTLANNAGRTARDPVVHTKAAMQVLAAYHSFPDDMTHDTLTKMRRAISDFVNGPMKAYEQSLQNAVVER